MTMQKTAGHPGQNGRIALCHAVGAFNSVDVPATASTATATAPRFRPETVSSRSVTSAVSQQDSCTFYVPINPYISN